MQENHLLRADWHTNLPRFQGARPDHVRVQSFAGDRELGHFNPGRVTQSPSIGNRSLVGRYNKFIYFIICYLYVDFIILFCSFISV